MIQVYDQLALGRLSVFKLARDLGSPAEQARDGVFVFHAAR